MIHLPNSQINPLFEQYANAILQEKQPDLIGNLGKAILESGRQIRQLQERLAERDQRLEALQRELSSITHEHQMLEPLAKDRRQEVVQLGFRVQALTDQLNLSHQENEKLIAHQANLSAELAQARQAATHIATHLMQERAAREQIIESATQVQVDQARRRDAHERHLSELMETVRQIKNGSSYKVLKAFFGRSVPLLGLLSEYPILQKIKGFSLQTLYWPCTAPQLDKMLREVRRIKIEMEEVGRVLGRPLNGELFAEFRDLGFFDS